MFPDADAPRSQRQWQRDRTVMTLEQAALRVFGRDGYETATAELISSEAGVSLRTFFRYFPHGKEDVMLLEARRTAARIREAIRQRPPSEPLSLAIRRALLSVSTESTPDELLEASRLYREIARDQPELLARVIGERQLRAERLVEVLAGRMGLDAEVDVRPRLLAHLLYATLSSAWLSWLRADGADLYRIIEQSIELLEPLLEAASPSTPS
jgi:AcrR family transcriptional regulator